MISNNKFRQLLLIWITISLFASCAKEREEEFVQGQGPSYGLLESESLIAGEIYDIQTKEKLYDSNIATANIVNIEEDSNLFNSFPVVKYETNAPYFDDIIFKAKSNSENDYKILRKINGTRLVYYKVANKENIPFLEHQIATRLHNSKLAVPLFSYQITGYFNVENIEDANGNKTSLKREIVLPQGEIGQFLKVDFSRKYLSDTILKQNVFPADFFKGEWIYNAEIIRKKNNRQNSGLMETLKLGVDFSFNEVSRIEFNELGNTLQGRNLNVDVDNAVLEGEDGETSFNAAIKIPFERVDFFLNENSQVEQHGDSNSRSRPSHMRKYVKLNLEGTRSVIEKSPDPSSVNIVDISLSDNYLGYTLHYTDRDIIIRYSMKRADEVINKSKQRVAWEDDMKRRFGFFTSKKASSDQRLVRDKDNQQKEFIKRYYPERNGNVITFYLSKNSADEFHEVAQQAIDEWNDVFYNQAQTGIQIKLAPVTKKVDIADVRYNIINFIDTKSTSSLGGYGPSVADSLSGEIVSATSNIYVNSTRQRYIDDLRNFVYFKIGKFGGENVIAKPNIDGDSRTYGLTDRFKALENLVNNQCRETLLPYISKLKDINKDLRADKKLTLIDDNTILEANTLEACANKAMRIDLLDTLLHELGHNFGLRHNFAGSADKENFGKDTKEHKHVTASIMDYMGAIASPVKKLGAYDVAAIRFAYNGEIQIAGTSGESHNHFVRINPNKTIDQNMKELGLTARNFEFCTDEQNNRNPYAFTDKALCIVWDTGSDPVEIVKNVITEVNAKIAFYRYRFDFPNAVLSTEVELAKALSYPSQVLLRIYNQYRVLMAKHLDQKDRYLSYHSAEEYLNSIPSEEELEKSFGVNSEEVKTFESYRQAANLITRFYIDLYTLPQKACFVADENGVLGRKTNGMHKFVMLTKLREDLKDPLIGRCDHPSVADYLESTTDDITEKGFHYNSYKTDEEYYQRENFYQDDVVGLKGIVSYAGKVLIEFNQNWSKYHSINKFHPTILDEPNLREEVNSYILSKITNGVDITQYGLDPEVNEFRYLPLFKHAYKDSVDSVTVFSNSFNSGTQTEKDFKKKNYKWFYGSRDSIIDSNAEAWTQISPGHYYNANPGAEKAVELITKMNNLQRITKLSGIVNERTADEFILAMESLLRSQESDLDIENSNVVDLSQKIKTLLDQTLELETNSNSEINLQSLALEKDALASQLEYMFSDLLSDRRFNLHLSNWKKEELNESRLPSEYFNKSINKSSLINQEGSFNERLRTLIREHANTIDNYYLYQEEINAQKELLQILIKKPL